MSLLQLNQNGGLWASPVDTRKSWEWWCTVEEYPYFNSERWFKLKLNTDKVLYIDNVEILNTLPDAPNPRNLPRLSWEKILDFEKLKQQYDAIEISLSKCSELYQALMAWDCDSIVILNKDVIEEIDSSENHIDYT